MEVHACSCSGNIWLLVLWGLGLLCKVSEYFYSFLSCYFRSGTCWFHWWAHFFWPVARTDARKGSLCLMSGSRLGLLQGVASCWFVTLCACGTHCMHHIGVIFSVFSFCYVMMGRKIVIVILSQHQRQCQWVVHKERRTSWQANQRLVTGIGNRRITEAILKFVDAQTSVK